jgi:hypothetical protein
MSPRSLRNAISTNGGQQIAPLVPMVGGEYGRNISDRPRGENFVLHGLLRSENLPGAVYRTAQQRFQMAANDRDVVSGAVMTDPTREEFDAKLTIVELRSENRFNELSSKMDRVVDSITVLNSTMASELSGVKSELMIVKADNKYTRWTIILAVLAALGALWVTQSNLLSAFQTGLLLKSEQATPTPSVPRPPSTH